MTKVFLRIMGGLIMEKVILICIAAQQNPSLLLGRDNAYVSHTFRPLG